MPRPFSGFLLAGAGMALLLMPVRLTADHGLRPPTSYAQFGKPDQNEGRKVIEDFRRQGIAAPYYLDFSLRVMPRRGPEKLYHGEMRGARNDQGTISRLSLRPAGNLTDTGELRLLIQNGPAPAVWRWIPAQPSTVTRLAVGELFQPVGETDLTAFDLQMPFLYWPDFTYEGLAKLRGRPAHQFLMYPPDDMLRLYPTLTGVRVYLDTQFNALVQAELIGEKNQVIKSITVLDLRKVKDQWIVESLDLRDETTHNKTRFEVQGAALNLDFVGTLFEPESLKDVVAPLPHDQVTWLQ
jgi:hypothetical protein